MHSATGFLHGDEHLFECLDHALKETLEVEFFLELNVAPCGEDDLWYSSRINARERTADRCASNVENDDEMLTGFRFSTRQEPHGEIIPLAAQKNPQNLWVSIIQP